MKRFEDKTNATKEQPGLRAVDALDAELDEALKNFKSSVHAWSEAAYSRPRTLAVEIRHRSWRVAAGWALGCALVAGSMSGGFLEQHHKKVLAQIAAQQREAEQQRQLREQQAKATETESDEVLLTGVDSDVSRQVPSAMELLAQPAADEETK